jgi:hypothetical protein
MRLDLKNRLVIMARRQRVRFTATRSMWMTLLSLLLNTRVEIPQCCYLVSEKYHFSPVARLVFKDNMIIHNYFTFKYLSAQPYKSL